MVRPGEGHRERLRPQAGAVARRAGRDLDEPQRPLAHPLALRCRRACAGRACGRSRTCRGSRWSIRCALPVGVHGDRRLLVGEEQPVAVLLRQLAPRPVDVEAQRREDARAGSRPARRPATPRSRRSRMLSDGSGTSELLGDVVHPAEAVALAGRRRPAVLGENASESSRRCARRVGHRRGSSSIRSKFDSVVMVPTVERALGAPRALLERDGRRQPGDLLDVRARRPAAAAAGRTARPTRSSAAAPRRRACRTRARTCPSRRRR